MKEYIHEQAKEIEVFDHCDVLVVGAGPAGTAAAVSAARNGAGKVVLLERYGHLGGMATGGQVLFIPHLSEGKQQMIAGIQQEWLDRLEKMPNGLIGPDRKDIGSTDPALIDKWRRYYGFVCDGWIWYGAYVDPEMLKIAMVNMVEDAGVTVYCHAWGSEALMEGNRVIGVTFQSKEGRKAILAGKVIDCTGDGDIFASAGCAYEKEYSGDDRSYNVSVVFRLGNVDSEEFRNWKYDPNSHYRDKLAEYKKLFGYRISPFVTPMKDIMWVNNFVEGKDCCNVQDLTDTEMLIRRSLNEGIEWIRENVPGFKNAFLHDTAPQLGTRGSRRLNGTYRLTMDDIAQTIEHEDTIAIIPAHRRMKYKSPIELPYGVMLPADDVEDLLAAGRCFSSAHDANDHANLIPHCVALGEAAGAAAALALQSNTTFRDVDVKKVQQMLKKQGVYLPR